MEPRSAVRSPPSSLTTMDENNLCLSLENVHFDALVTPVPFSGMHSTSFRILLVQFGFSFCF